MDYQKFIDRLPRLYENWGEPNLTPKSQQFQDILARLQTVSNLNLMQLLNCAIEYLEPGEVYCEIGCDIGIDLVGGLLNCPDKMAYAVDRFSSNEDRIELLLENLSRFDVEERVFFCQQDFEEFFFDLRKLNLEEKIGVYFDRSSDDYRSRLLSLLLVKSFLSDKALILIENSQRESVQQAIWDFLAANDEFDILLKLDRWSQTSDRDDCSLLILRYHAGYSHEYDWNAIQERHQPSIKQGIANLSSPQYQEFCFSLYQEALTLHHQDRLDEAEKKYKQFLFWNPNHSPAWFNLSIIDYSLNRFSAALEAIQKYLAIDESDARAYFHLGSILEKFNNLPDAIEAHKKAIDLDINYIDAYNNLGNIFYRACEFKIAESVYRKAIEINSDRFGSYLNLGNALLAQNCIQEAIENYQLALKLDPENSDVKENIEFAIASANNPIKINTEFGDAFYRQNQYAEAIERYQKIVQSQAADANVYLKLAECLKSSDRIEEALKILAEATQLYPKESKIHCLFVLYLRDCGRIEGAIAKAEEASSLLPNDFALKLQSHLLLPILYNEPSEIELYRQRFSQGLQNLLREIDLSADRAIDNAVEGLKLQTNFYLHYQGLNDVELQKQYGQLLHRTLAAKYPQWSQPIAMPTPIDGEKIRIGYLSTCMRENVVGRVFIGWLRNCDRQQFEIYSYSIHRQQDNLTQQFQHYSDTFHHIPDNLEAVCQQIIDDRLHILVFLDMGMVPEMMLLGSLRLAPIQCKAWGPPITSGLPTIDYFLSSDLMEPDDAQLHYSESLVRLPNLGFSYLKPAIPETSKTRLDFQLREDATVYFSCQSLYKYLPQYDYLFVEIAKQNSKAQFVFLASKISQCITEQFRQRLQRAFFSQGLAAEDYCVILPHLNSIDYFNVHQLSDIYLDTLSWSGGVTTLEAIACHLPVVTCPGQFLRGRHADGILKMLGVTDTIANNEAEYIEIAVRLGLDREWRQSIVQRMSDRHQYLYDDRSCVKALEAFYKQAVRGDRPV
jgi:protein O-GlcNAc transferase